jgi:NADH:ubiquinone oxidoreductase subunit 6 (subunit J)
MLTDWIYAIAFFATAAATVASALMVVLHRNPVINALYLVL